MFIIFSEIKNIILLMGSAKNKLMKKIKWLPYKTIKKQIREKQNNHFQK